VQNRLGEGLGYVDNLFLHYMLQSVEFRQVEQVNRLDDLVHHVDGIVHRLDQVLDVAAVERSDEGATRGQEHFGSHDVRLLLQLHDPAAIAFNIFTGKQAFQRLGTTDDETGVPFEQIEEPIFVWQKLAEPSQHLGVPCNRLTPNNAKAARGKRSMTRKIGDARPNAVLASQELHLQVAVGP